MPARPRNECLECGYGWYPRGNDRSRKCPNCGVVFTHWNDDRQPERAGRRNTAALGIGACVVFGVIALVCIGAFASNRAPQPEAEKEPERAAQDKKLSPPDPKGAAPPPVARDETDTKPKSAPVPAVEVAPLPRRVTNLPAENHVTDWVRRGAVEVRLVAAAVARPMLVDGKGAEYRGPDRVLLVRVQSRRVAGAPSELRRWVGALNTAATALVAGREVQPVRFPAAALVGQLDKGVSMTAGGAAVDDIVAFPAPDATVESVTVVLSGEHVKEAGQFAFRVPAQLWK